MGFETKVLNAVETMTDGAYFYNGTLCIPDVCKDTALAIRDMLEGIVTCKVEITDIAIEGEYLVDFV